MDVGAGGGGVRSAGVRGRTLRSLMRRTREVGLGQVGLIAEAFLLMVAARVALRVISVRRILEWQGRVVGGGKARLGGEGLTAGEARERVERVRHAVRVAVRYAPMELVCFPQCLAASALLRRRGLRTRLHYGVRREAGRLDTHTWLESDGEEVVGGEVAGGYSELGVY